MRAVHLTLSIAALAGMACVEQRPPAASQPETTSALCYDPGRGDLAIAQRERNEAQAQLAQERAARDADGEKHALENRGRVERDALEVRMVDALVRSHASHGAKNAKRDALEGKLLDDLKRVHGDRGDESWDTFRAEVESTLVEMDKALPK